METIGVFDIKTNISALLKRVESGEQIGISRRGKPIARLIPEPLEEAKPNFEEIKAGFAALRTDIKANGGPPFTWEELKSYRDEGRK
jgi:prevent-host-death family protein